MTKFQETDFYRLLLIFAFVPTLIQFLVENLGKTINSFELGNSFTLLNIVNVYF